jgi:hypothetical protein
MAAWGGLNVKGGGMLVADVNPVTGVSPCDGTLNVNPVGPKGLNTGAVGLRVGGMGISLRVGSLMTEGLLSASPIENIELEASALPDVPGPEPPESNAEVVNVDVDTDCLFNPESNIAVGFDSVAVSMGRVAHAPVPVEMVAVEPDATFPETDP